MERKPERMNPNFGTLWLASNHFCADVCKKIPSDRAEVSAAL
jgi:hypothetical protein